MGFVNVFGGSAVAPSNVQFLAIDLSENTELVWPLESAEGAVYLAAQLDVTPSTSGLSIAMPPANLGSTGIATVATNYGTDDFDFTDNGGTLIQTVAAGESYIISLTDNSSVNGTWAAIQLGAGAPSGALAAALAGAGLIAISNRLNSNIITNSYSTNQTLSTSHRAKANLFTGTMESTFTLDPISTVTAGWWTIVANTGSANLVVATSGSDTIDDAASISLPPSDVDSSYSALVVAMASGFQTFFLPPIPTPITAGGTGATDASGALVNLGGTGVGISIFTAPTVAAVLSILGINQSLLTEVTLTADQVVGSSDGGKAYVCTATLELTLPEADTLTTSFYFCVFAQGGDVTITPNGVDSINNGIAGASLDVPEGSSLLMVTDAASPGIWFPLFLATAPSGVWSDSGGSANVITATYSPAYVSLTDGLLLGFRAGFANSSTTPTFSPDGLTAHTIVKASGAPLAPGDIAGDGAEYLVRYNLANTNWVLLNPSTTEPPWVAAGGTADAITATYVPAIPALYDGLLLGFRATAANATSTPTFAPNGLTAHTIVKVGGVALTVGDIPAALAECVVRYNLANTRWELLNPALPPVGAGTTVGTYSALKIVNKSGTENTQSNLTASAVSVTTSSGSPSVVLTALNLTIDITTSGANGLDTGSVAPSTWYSVWVIYNGTTKAGLFSTNPTTPTLPSGYTFYARMGWMRTDGSSHLLRTLQYGDRAQYTLPPLPIMISGSSGSVTVPTWTAVPVGNYVPSTASAIALILSNTNNSSEACMSAPNNGYGRHDSATNPAPLEIGATTGFESNIYGNFLLESSNVYYASEDNGAGLACLGWQDNL